MSELEFGVGIYAFKSSAKSKNKKKKKKDWPDSVDTTEYSCKAESSANKKSDARRWAVLSPATTG